MTWWNDYIEIPYLERGRDRDGLDCWGLARLVHKEQFGNELPSYVSDYSNVEDREHLEELLTINRQSWTRIAKPAPGDIVLFRILGVVSHVGVMCDEDSFLHIRAGANSTIEKLESSRWASRVEGFYRYEAASGELSVVAAANPVKVQRLHVTVGPGMSVQQLLDLVRVQQEASDAIPWDATVWVNGRIVEKEDWAVYCPSAGSRVEIRVVPKGGVLRTVATIAVIVAAAQFAPNLLPLALEGTAVAGAATAAIQAGLTFAGMALVNAIFPVRLPKTPDLTGGERVNLLKGSNNSATPYSAIPVVLGRMRSIPPAAAQPFVEFGPSDTYLHLLVCWGFGPLQVTDIFMGTNSINTYEDVEVVTLEGRAGESTTELDRIYGQDITQIIPDATLECFVKSVSSLTVASNVLTVVTTEAHGFGTNWVVSITDLGRFTIVSVVNPTTFTVAYVAANGTIPATGKTATASNWVEQDINALVDRIRVDLHFPEGHRRINMEGGKAGPTEVNSRYSIQYRRLNPTTLAQITPWTNVEVDIQSKKFSLARAYYDLQRNAVYGNNQSPVYQWTRVVADRYGNLSALTGEVSDFQNADASAGLKSLLNGDRFTLVGLNDTYTRLPAVPAGSTLLYEVCVYGDTIVQVVDARTAGGVTGCALTQAGREITVASGTISRPNLDTLSLGAAGEPHHLAKDGFTYSVSVDVPLGRYQVRVRRSTTSEKDGAYSGSGNKYTNLYTSIFQAVTGYSNGKPFIPPFPMAVTAIKVKATGQINGQLPPISGTVQCICLDWNGSAWVERPTRNPASLFRHVLQNKANAQRVSDSMLNLTEIQDFHNFCRTNGFMYDRNVLEQQSLEDLLDDICAAGRASKVRKDGRWTVVIDRPRTQISQYLTPHNSWGFQGSRPILRIPHAFRVDFVNAEKGFQPDELVVYNDGYSAANATVFEKLEFPGVTDSRLIFKHARFHFAQLKLRAETYTVNMDIEHLICNRGDLVRVVHDAPMWGLDSGRIKNFVNTTTLQLDEPVLLDAGTQYTIRIRQDDGSSLTRTVAAKATKGYYDQITLTTTLTSTQGAAGLLYMLGTLNAESVELIVQGIEPADNMTARLTLVDYAPAVYNSDAEEIPAFDSRITTAVSFSVQEITASPAITLMQSGEGVLLRQADGTFDYGLQVSFRVPSNLPSTVDTVQAEIDFNSDGLEQWTDTQTQPIRFHSFIFRGLVEGAEYRVRIRFVNRDGRVGPWRYSSVHQIVGRTNPPRPVTGFTAQAEGAGLRLSWTGNVELDTLGYEIRTSDSGWGTAAQPIIFKGSTTTALYRSVTSSTTFYIRAFDTGNRYSQTSASATFVPQAVPNVADITHTFADTSLTNATVTLDWPDVTPQFGLRHYEVTFASSTKLVLASTITLPADWTGNRTFTVKAVDQRGVKSSGVQEVVSKLAPNPVSNVRAQVVDNNVLLSWTLPAKTTLPIAGTRLKKGATYATAQDIGSKAGAFTSVFETLAGTYTYWIETFDTDNVVSTPVSVTVMVNEPPGFVFNGKLESTMVGGTLVNAVLEAGSVVMPVNTTETFEQHFTSRTWNTPQDQINAGFPVYVQPGNLSGSYQETFDFLTVISSSRITVGLDGTFAAGSGTVTVSLEASANGTTWTTLGDTQQAFATSFRYVRVKVTAAGTNTTIYRLQGFTVTLDAKLKEDAGTVSALSTDPSGTIVNFQKEFLDVSAINVTPSGVTSLNTAYDFQDAILSGTYTVTSNVATVNVTAHGLVVGQKVKLGIITGSGISGVYTVATVPNANSFTVSMTVANTSGNLVSYPQGFRAYVFNSTTGARTSATLSWAVKGY